MLAVHHMMHGHINKFQPKKNASMHTGKLFLVSDAIWKLLSLLVVKVTAPYIKMPDVLYGLSSVFLVTNSFFLLLVHNYLNKYSIYKMLF